MDLGSLRRGVVPLLFFFPCSGLIARVLYLRNDSQVVVVVIKNEVHNHAELWAEEKSLSARFCFSPDLQATCQPRVPPSTCVRPRMPPCGCSGSSKCRQWGCCPCPYIHSHRFFTHTNSNEHTHTNRLSFSHTHTHTHTHTHNHAHTTILQHTHTHIHTHTHKRVYIHRHRRRHTITQTRTHTHTCRQIDGQTARLMDTFYELWHTATYCKTLPHTATHCSTLQHTAAHCNTR